MPKIRLLTQVAGDLAAGVPAPGVGAVIDVDETVAASWADGTRAVRVEEPPAPPVPPTDAAKTAKILPAPPAEKRPRR